MKAKNNLKRTAKKNPGHSKIQAPRSHAAPKAPAAPGGDGPPKMNLILRRHQLSTYQPPQQ